MSAYDLQQQTCLEYLIELKAPSRLGARDDSLFIADPGDSAQTQSWTGWAALCSNPPYPIELLQQHADEIRSEGLSAVVLIGQGGSSQAAMTITMIAELKGESNVDFKTMDMLSPVFVNHILGSLDPSRTLYIVSSKSGSTIEVLSLERVVWHYVSAQLGSDAAAQRFVAITDPGSGLEKLAQSRHYRLVINTPADVGGRFSALTAFALFPAALVGIDIKAAVAKALITELECRSDSPDNPALKLACFLYDAYLDGRDKFSLVLPPSGQVFGLWVEQLVAESLGKQGKGILPNIETDASVLIHDRSDRSVITICTGDCDGFKHSISVINKQIPALSYTIGGPQEAFSHFVMWEYATAFLGILVGVFPFDQPDVEITKRFVREMLSSQVDSMKSSGEQMEQTAPPNLLQHDDYCEINYESGPIRSLRISNALSSVTLNKPPVILSETKNLNEDSQPITPDEALRMLFASISKGDYFSLNAFVPFKGFDRREALERIRNRVASRLGVVSCLEIGPRYLHSTGQFHKGGPNTGVFLLLSADENNDISVPGESYTLGTLAKFQAQADFAALASRNRRIIHIHLASNKSESLSRFADQACAAISATVMST